ncbi:hypothetical protein JCM5350_005742 [Sporobolomyces pararoseus]
MSSHETDESPVELSISTPVIDCIRICTRSVDQPYDLRLVCHPDQPSQNALHFIHDHHSGEILFDDLEVVKFAIIQEDWDDFAAGSVIIELSVKKGASRGKAYRATYEKEIWFTHSGGGEIPYMEKGLRILFVTNQQVAYGYVLGGHAPRRSNPVEKLLDALWDLSKEEQTSNGDGALTTQRKVIEVGVEEREFLFFQKVVITSRVGELLAHQQEMCDELNADGGRTLDPVPGLFDVVETNYDQTFEVPFDADIGNPEAGSTEAEQAEEHARLLAKLDLELKFDSE